MTSKTAKTKPSKSTLSKLKPKPYKLVLLHPVTFKPIDGEPWVKIVGQNSPEFYKATVAIKNNVKLKQDDVDFDDLQTEAHTGMAACIIDWDVEFFEEEFSTEAAIKMMNDPSLGFIATQIQVAIENTANFF